MSDETKTRDHISTVVLREGLQRVAWDFVRVNWRAIAIGVLGFVAGAATVKIKLANALTAAHDAKAAAVGASNAVGALRAELKELATEREMVDVNHRVDDVVTILAHAQQVAGEPPNGKRNQSRK